MKTSRTFSERILSVASCNRGFAFVVIEEDRGLVDWGIKRMNRKGELMKCEELQALITLYMPDRVVTESSAKRESQNIMQRTVQIADHFPELAPRFPHPRKAWEGRNPNAALYRAAGLAQTALSGIHKKSARDC